MSSAVSFINQLMQEHLDDVDVVQLVAIFIARWSQVHLWFVIGLQRKPRRHRVRGGRNGIGVLHQRAEGRVTLRSQIDMVGGPRKSVLSSASQLHACGGFVSGFRRLAADQNDDGQNDGQDDDHGGNSDRHDAHAVVWSRPNRALRILDRIAANTDFAALSDPVVGTLASWMWLVGADVALALSVVGTEVKRTARKDGSGRADIGGGVLA
mmetsp:Transcript_26847/g.75357  ORF Transcript_26847/g.75357 Transcript_26847/m.75357 type:complete len:210 (-) Transcript_26847:2029-2658(-)